jgi:Smg protein
MFEILMFLFENYMDGNILLKTDNETVVSELQRVGFDRFEIDRALNWIEGLQCFHEAGAKITSKGMRYYLSIEMEHIGIAGIDFITHLERLKIIDPLTREIVIDRIMALDSREVDMGRIKWVILMVLFHQPDKKSALSLLQDMILADAFDSLH